ncbi:hypothetical protein ACXR2U_12800 [Jatrophihabitans sp. YIM 134969]
MTVTPPPSAPVPGPEPSDVWAPPAAWAPPPPAAPPARPWVTRRELRAGALVVGVLVVVGVLAGFVWLWWSPSRGIALALGPHTLLPDETENFVAADGRYAVLTAAVGVLAGVGGWLWRAVRGPVLALALGVGAGAGAVLTALVGRLFGGGVSGAVFEGQRGPIVTPHLELRATGLLALEAIVALLIYGVLVTVSARDDLGTGEDPPDDDPDAPDASVFPPA